MRFDIKIEGANELAIQLDKMSKGIKKESKSALIEIGSYLKEKIKEKFGVYQAGWPKLKRASVMAKYKRRGSLKGMPTKGRNRSSFGLGADDPLVLFGELQKSIKKETSQMQTTVYSDNVYAAVHEYGYKNVPARSYMRSTLWDEVDEIKAIVDKMISRVI